MLTQEIKGQTLSKRKESERTYPHSPKITLHGYFILSLSCITVSCIWIYLHFPAFHVKDSQQLQLLDYEAQLLCIEVCRCLWVKQSGWCASTSSWSNTLWKQHKSSVNSLARSQSRSGRATGLLWSFTTALVPYALPLTLHFQCIHLQHIALGSGLHHYPLNQDHFGFLFLRGCRFNGVG